MKINDRGIITQSQAWAGCLWIRPENSTQVEIIFSNDIGGMTFLTKSPPGSKKGSPILKYSS